MSAEGKVLRCAMIADNRQASNGLVAGMLFAVGGLVLAALFPLSSGYSYLDRANYTALLFAYAVFAILVTTAIIRRDLSVFEPLTLVTTLMFCTFVLYPLRDVLMHDMVSHGKDVSEGCIKATAIVTFSYALLHIFYYTGKDRGRLAGAVAQGGRQISDVSLSRNVTIILGVWILSFCACILVMFQSGMSVSYLFSLGLRGEYVVSEERTVLLFLSNFGTSLVTCWIYLLFNARSRLLKVILTLLTALYMFARMSRWLLLVVLVAPVVYYFSMTHERLSKRVVLRLFLVFIAIAAWMQLYRYGFRRGTADSLTLTWSFETLMGPFRSDFTTYKAVYGMVQEIPANHGYYLGRSTFLNFFTMMIPRAIWPGKPLKAPVNEIVSLAVNDSAAAAGMAFYNVGEYYADFGPLGAFVLMSVFGYVLGRFLEPKRNSSNINDLLAFSVMYPLLFQWTARGNTGANIWLTIFAMLPVELLRFMGDER